MGITCLSVCQLVHLVGVRATSVEKVIHEKSSLSNPDPVQTGQIICPIVI